MSKKQILLDIAAFLDSGPSVMLSAPDRDGQRKVLEAFLEVCYNELGSAPRLLDGDGIRTALTQRMPLHFKAKDPVAKFAPEVIGAYLEHLVGIANVPFAFEMKLGLQDAEAAYLEALAKGPGGVLATGRKPDPFQHGAAKLGRNDPCSCGSGKKYKKCHGKKDSA